MTRAKCTLWKLHNSACSLLSYQLSAAMSTLHTNLHLKMTEYYISTISFLIIFSCRRRYPSGQTYSPRWPWDRFQPNAIPPERNTDPADQNCRNRCQPIPNLANECPNLPTPARKWCIEAPDIPDFPGSIQSWCPNTHCKMTTLESKVNTVVDKIII